MQIECNALSLGHGEHVREKDRQRVKVWANKHGLKMSRAYTVLLEGIGA